MAHFFTGLLVGLVLGAAGGGFVAYRYVGAALRKAQAALAALKS